MEGKTKYLKNAVIFSFLAGIFAHNLFGRLGWYDSAWWLDDVMHTLGGAWVAFFFLIFLIKGDNYSNLSSAWKTFIITLGFAALVGVLWEFYEYLKDVYIFNKHPLASAPDPLLLPDTLLDLFNDLVGGAITFVVFYIFSRRNRLAPYQNSDSKKP